MNNRKSINFFQSYYDISKELDDKPRLEWYDTIMKIQFLEIHIDDIEIKNKELKLLFISIKHSLKSSIEGYCHRKKLNYSELFKPHNSGTHEGGHQGASQGGHEQEEEQEKEKEKEEQTKKPNEFDVFIDALKKTVPHKSKVTKTKEGEKLFKAIQDKNALFRLYVEYQKEKQEFAVRITAYMQDFETVHYRTKPQPTKADPLAGYKL